MPWKAWERSSRCGCLFTETVEEAEYRRDRRLPADLQTETGDSPDDGRQQRQRAGADLRELEHCAGTGGKESSRRRERREPGVGSRHYSWHDHGAEPQGFAKGWAPSWVEREHQFLATDLFGVHDALAQGW
jgi:hypothetical protein